jgi:hypothetical protein
VFEDFERLLGKKTLLVIDEFYMIKQRGNARMRIFMDKIISRRVSLILVSVNELKLDFLPRMKKIKLDFMDSFETEVLAYNIINIVNEEEVVAYNNLKKIRKKENRLLTIKEIDECRKKTNLPVTAMVFKKKTTAT